MTIRHDYRLVYALCVISGGAADVLENYGDCIETSCSAHLLQSRVTARRTHASAQDACADTLAFIAKARRTIEAVPYGGNNSPQGHPVSLITQDAQGYASARTVVPREISEDLSFFRLNTPEGTRKLGELAANPRTTLHVHDQRGRQGWLTIKGDSIMQHNSDGTVDILFTAQKLESMSYTEGLMADKEGFKPISLARQNGCWMLESQQG
eukprot:TRINITY_DN31730_c0_g1_i1.p1 TRINITY_DN31730_c0_g1~~TRINITY_DN31730_c0_g1_i1.p1  ORF type:complete len:227 (+),score=19.39 TRINITY_DN31730_c0_g1_i1:52-681(+)